MTVIGTGEERGHKGRRRRVRLSRACRRPARRWQKQLFPGLLWRDGGSIQLIVTVVRFPPRTDGHYTVDEARQAFAQTAPNYLDRSGLLWKAYLLADDERSVDPEAGHSGLRRRSGLSQCRGERLAELVDPGALRRRYRDDGPLGDSRSRDHGGRGSRPPAAHGCARGLRRGQPIHRGACRAAGSGRRDGPDRDRPRPERGPRQPA